MLRTKLFPAALLALAPSPALADVTARYGVDGKELVVEVDEGGNSRVELAGKFAIIRRDGTDYLVVHEKAGPKVFEFQAVAALFKTALPKAAAPEAEKMRFGIEPGPASAAVAGRVGSVWLLRMVEGTERNRKQHVEIVMSPDPQLAPVGQAIARAADVALDFMGGFLPESTQFGASARAILAKGAPRRGQPIDSGKPDKTGRELRAVDGAEIDPGHFVLPAPVTPTEEIFGSMDALMRPGAGKIENLP